MPEVSNRLRPGRAKVCHACACRTFGDNRPLWPKSAYVGGAVLVGSNRLDARATQNRLRAGAGSAITCLMVNLPQFDDDLDTRGLLCPLPVLKARKRLAALAPGSVLRVRATDPATVVDMPHFCAEAGHILLAAGQDGAQHVYLIRRGDTQNARP